MKASTDQMASDPSTGPSRKIKVIRPELPKGGGDLTGLGETFSPNEFSGSSGLSIPIPATPCRGFEPRLSINYSSGNGNGPFGLGCELSLPDISRQTSLCIPKYDSSDIFLYSGDGYLVPELDRNGQRVKKSATVDSKPYTVERYRPRTAEAFDIIERYTNPVHPSDVFWVVTSTDNTTSIFGKSAAAKIYDPGDPRHIFKWLLEETYDAKGNHQVYTYSKENGENIPPILSAHRDSGAQSYLSKISYGNDQPLAHSILLNGTDPNTIDWHFEIVLDYGQYNVDAKNPDPYTVPSAKEWACREDPFSDYRAGFEIRTCRLCHNLLLFHHFPKEFNTKAPVLTERLELNYDQSPVLSQLAKAQSSAYLFTPGANPPYQTKSRPPLELGYSPFAPSKPGYIPHGYGRLAQDNGNGLVGLSRPPYSQLVDLYGRGIPGVLYADGESVCYNAPRLVSEQEVEYSGPTDIPFPLSRRDHDPTHTLTDLSGEGHLDLLVSIPGQAGYYQIDSRGTWQPWQSIPTFPTDFHGPRQQHVDVTGSGRADLLLIERDEVRVCPAQGTSGYGPAYSRPRPAGLPDSATEDPASRLTFTGMCGLGQAQFTRLGNGLVECWPSLGYGTFGERVQLENAPNFGPDFDISRLRLTDLDGSGLADIAYIYPDRVEIYLNQSGNSFARTPIRIPLPEPWDSLDQIQFADVLGNGAECLVYTTAHSQPQQWFYDFNQATWTHPVGKSETISQKPYLLTEIRNNLGAKTLIRYTSSTTFYLQDQEKGLDWVTRLPFPVQVVASVTHVDPIAETATLSSYTYHQGYYDGYEREFMGFGRVDRTDEKFFADFIPGKNAQEAAYHAPPVLTKTWYHTGAWLEASDLLAEFAKEYWSGDSKAYNLPKTTWLFLDGADSDIWREAHRTLHGTVLRREVYGKDETPWQETPYSVAETQFVVKQLQEKAANPYAVFLVHERESIRYDYERNADDPRVSHDFVLEIDAYGQVLKSASLAYGRRADQIPADLNKQTAAQQKALRIIYTENTLINSPQLTNADFHLLGIPEQSKSYEVTGIAHHQGAYFTFAEFKKALTTATAKKQLLHWERDYYYDAAAKKELPLGQVTAQALDYRTEFIEFEKGSLEAVYDGVQTADQLKALLEKKGGYIEVPACDPESAQAQKYYWNPGNAQTYFGETAFYLTNAFLDPFQNTTTYQYDPYQLLITRVTDPLGNTVQVTKIDYRHLAPTQIQDINDNTSEVLFDPLGIVIATSFHGTQNGQVAGFAPLSQYAPVPHPTLEDVMSNPEKYLQNAGSYFYYDLFSWMERKTPLHFATLMAEQYPADKKQSGLIQKAVTYSDGSGRHLQSKAFLDSTETVRCWDAASQKVVTSTSKSCWLTSGAVRYDDKGQPIKQFEPYFAPDYHYVNERALNEVGYSDTLFYDSLGRHVLTVTPEGFLTKTLFGAWGTAPTGSFSGYLNQKLYASLPNEFVPSPWSSLHFDANDTIKESVCYQTYEKTGKSPSKDVNGPSLQEAAKCFNTPMIAYTDSLGQTVQTQQFNVAASEQDAAFLQLDILGDVLTSDDQRQYSATTVRAEYFEGIGFSTADARTLYSALQHPSVGVSPLLNSDGAVTPAFEPNNAQFLSQMTTFLTALGKEFVAKKALIIAALGQIGHNFVMSYNLSKEAVKTVSADGGVTWMLNNAAGNPFWSCDSRGTSITHTFDALQRPVSVQVQNDGRPDPWLKLDQTVQRLIYGDSRDEKGVPFFSAPEQRNLRGQAVITFDQSGLDLTPFFTIQAQPQAAGKILTSDYKSEPNWDSLTDQSIAHIASALTKLKAPGGLGALKAASLNIPALETTLYASTSEYDALGRVTASTDPDGNTARPQYYTTGWLKSTATTTGKSATGAAQKARVSAATPAISNITYNAKGQRTALKLGNGVETTYTYDERNFRLLTIQSVRGAKTLQDLSYHNDPVGNVTSMADHSIPTVFFQNEKVKPESSYSYDTLYRLTAASGREHTAMWRNLQQHQNKLSALRSIPGPSQPTQNGKALQNYTQSYSYDASGNLTKIQHRAKNTNANRTMTIAAHSNRLQSCAFGSQAAQQTRYDLQGNQLTLGGLTTMRWNYRDNMQSTVITKGKKSSDVEYYVYNAGGKRVRKVRATVPSAGVTNISETIYLGSFEIRRRSRQAGKARPKVRQEWHWVNVADCRWGYLTSGTPTKGAQGYQLRYQLTNQLESSTLEVNEQGQVITYEEYYPYGGTSIIAARSAVEVKQKYYRYSGKEEDGATGLYCYGLRYYCPWLGRWTSPDPAGTIDGLNLFAFVGGNPVTEVDVGGMGKAKTKAKGKGPTFIGRPKSHPKGKDTKTINKANVAGALKNKKYKENTFRSHWKGPRSKGGTSGIKLGITKRDSKPWSEAQKKRNRERSDELKQDPSFTGIGVHGHGSEISHTIAGSNYGPNDELSAHPASVHQNTEWLAIETGVKELINDKNDFRVKVTNYIHDGTDGLKGTLKASRYKIYYLNGKKVFDQVALGDRGNISKEEANDLFNRVRSLTSSSPKFTLGSKNPKGIHGEPPSLAKIQAGRTDSSKSPMFTDLKFMDITHNFTSLTGEPALKRMRTEY